MGCGAASTQQTVEMPPPPVDDDLLSLIPRRVNAVLWVDMAALRSSAIFEAIAEFLGDKEMPLIQSAPAFNPIYQSQEIVFAFSKGVQDSPDQLLVLVKGEFDSLDVLHDYSKKEGVTFEKTNTMAVARSEEFVAVGVTQRTLAVGTDLLTRSLIKIVEGQGRSLRDNPAFSNLALDNGETARLRYRRGVIDPDLTRYGVSASGIDVKAVDAIDGEMTAQEGIEIDLSLTTRTQMDASSIESELKSAKATLNKNMFVLLLGIDWAFDRVTISSAKKSVNIAVTLNAADIEEIEQLATRLKKIRELASDGDAGTAAPQGESDQ